MIFERGNVNLKARNELLQELVAPKLRLGSVAIGREAHELLAELKLAAGTAALDHPQHVASAVHQLKLFRPSANYLIFHGVSP
jgi:hypothetical protein